MSRRVLTGGALLLVAGGAMLLALWLGGVLGGGGARLGREAYLDRLQRLCREADRTLAKIPPPSNLSDPGEISRSIGRALPLLERYVARERSLLPPPELRAQVDRAFELTDRSVRSLEESRRRALRGDAPGALEALERFLAERDRARAAARALGLRC
jgi:hypothetical protein